LIRPGETLAAGWWDGVGWRSSRVITDTEFPGDGERTMITEFPAFSWILGDLHPHVITFPWLIAAFALTVNFYLLLRRGQNNVDGIVAAAASGGVTGMLYMSNSWDVPAAALIFAAAIGLSIGCARRRDSALAFAIWIASALVVALPFAVAYDPAAGATDYSPSGVASLIPGASSLGAMVGYVDWDRTSVLEVVIVHGGFLFLLAVVRFGLWGESVRSEFARRRVLLAVAASTLVILAILTVTPALALIGIPFLLLMLVVLTGALEEEHRFPAVMLACALFMILVTEFVYIRDPFADRMNTVFKVYFQVWALMAIALGALMPAAVSRLVAVPRQVVSVAGIAAIVLIMLGTSLYVPLSSYRWYEGFSNWRGIDGVAWIEDLNAEERAAVEWLRETVSEDAVILEAPGCSYGSDSWLPHSRVSMMTGIPTVIGWAGHQFQWRRQQPGVLPQIEDRIVHVRIMYSSPFSEPGASLLEEYGVTHVVVGTHELNGYAQCAHWPPHPVADVSTWETARWELGFVAGRVSVYVRE
jgi:YYY domain-containing protein